MAIYVTAWIITIRHIKRKSGVWGPACVLFTSYAIYAVLSLVLIVYYGYLGNGNTTLTFFPLVYLFAMLWISGYPIIQFEEKRYIAIAPPKNHKLLKYFTYFYIVVSFTQFPRIISSINKGITLIMLEASGGADLYYETKQNEGGFDGAISNLLAIIYGAFTPLLFFLLFYYLTRARKSKIIIGCLLFCILISALSGISYGQRTSSTMLVMSFVISYFAFKRFFTKEIINKVKKIALIGTAIVLIPFSYLTISRFGETESGTQGSVVSYLGQSVINFDRYGLSANGIRYGDRTCNMFKHLLGFSDTPKGMSEVRTRYSYMKMDDSVFSTFVGDFTLDFGPISAFVLFVIFSYMCTKMTETRGRVIPFHKMILCYIAMIICMQGGMYLFTFSFSGNISLIAMAFFYLVFYFDYNPIKSADNGKC